MLCLGIESTAHTFAIGIVEDEKILADVRDTYAPEKGGIHPMEAQLHHERVKEKILEDALKQADLTLDKIDIFSYSKGPGMPPSLKVGAQFIAKISESKPIMEVNHAIAHLEIGRLLCKSKDPIFLYVSGGNTQVIGYASGKYRIFGETQDIPIGNAIDTFIREIGLRGSMGGPVLEKMAQGGSYIELPYIVKGMDLSFSGILTAAVNQFKKDKSDENIRNLCFSFQETCYAMLTEVAERALAHTRKKELLVTGGVAASKRLREMLETMCAERKASFYSCPKEYSGDNGVMIAHTGLLAYNAGQKPVTHIDFIQKWRPDGVAIPWRV